MDRKLSERNGGVAAGHKRDRGRRTGVRKRPYRTPRLERLGDVRDLTLGGSPGAGDSGSANTRDWPV